MVKENIHVNLLVKLKNLRYKNELTLILKLRMNFIKLDIYLIVY